MGNYYCKNCDVSLSYYINNKLPHNRPSCRGSKNRESGFYNGYHNWEYYYFNCKLCKLK